MEHGGSMYVARRCRCVTCKAGNAKRSAVQREERHGRLVAGEIEVEHGASTYNNYRCRCGVCCEAKQVQNRRRREP